MRKKLSYILALAIYPILGMLMDGLWGAFYMSILLFANLIFIAVAYAFARHVKKNGFGANFMGYIGGI